MSLEIANLALDHIGSTPLSRLDRSGDLMSQTILRNLDAATKYVLKRCNWSELTLSVCPDELAICDPDCDFPKGFCHAYALPGDFVRVYDVEPFTGAGYGVHRFGVDTYDLHYSIRKIKTKNGTQEALLTDCSPVRMEYVCLPKDLGTLDSDVIDLIGLQLAIRISTPLKADKSLRKELKGEFAMMLEDAAMTSGSQDAERLQVPNGFLTGPRVGNHDILRTGSEPKLIGRKDYRNRG